MSQTKIVLNRQSDLILDNAQITNPSGIKTSNIYNEGTDEMLHYVIESLQLTDSQQISNRVAGDESLTADLSTEASARLVAASELDGKLTDAINSELSLRVAAVTAEESARIAGDANLQNQIDNVLSNVDPEALDSLTEIVGAFQSADDDLNGAIIALSEAATSSLSAEVEARISDVDAEQARAESAEAVLTAALSHEVSKRTEDMDTEVSARIADVDAEESARIAAVDAEESRAMFAEAGLFDSILSEEGRAMDAEASLATFIAAEHSEHIANELSIVTAMDAADSAEASARIAGDASLTADLSSEASRATAAEGLLATNFNADIQIERSRAIAAEGVLTADLSSEVAARETAIDNEASARIDGDQSLQNQIDFITDNTDAAAIDSLTEIVAAFQSADGEINGAITTLADAAGANLSTEVARATSAESVLTADLSTEVAAREAAVSMEEAARIADVDAEESRAIAAEGSLATNLTAEASRATAAEGVLTADLSAEVAARIADVDAEESRAISAELVLTNNLSTEMSARIADVDAEESRAIAAEGVLTADLSSEVANRGTAVTAEASYRVAGDLSLQNQIDFITENIDPVAIDSLTEIVAAFQTADGDINGAITELADAAGANLSTEVARATSAEAVLTSDLSSEVARAQSAEYSLEMYVDEMDGALQSSMLQQMSIADASVATEANNKINQEVSIRLAADDSIATNLSSEVSNRIADVDAEESRAESAEAVLTADLSSEMSARIADVDAEESRAMSAEAVLTADLSSEVAARISEDTKLTYNLNTEISNREEDVDNEEYRATTAEASLASDLSSEVANRGTAVDAEASYRVSGDLSLQNQIDFITDNVDAAAIDSLTEIVSAFQSADGDINNAITTLADAAGANLSTEVERATSAEAVLTADLSSEVSAREDVFSAIDTKMTAEISARIADVDAEESRAIAAEDVLTSDLSSEVANRIADVDAEESRAIEAEDVLTSDLSSEVANREAAISTEESMRLEADASIAAELSSDIEALADVDGTTIVLNAGTNQIELAEEVAAPASGIRTLMGEIDIETILKVGGVDVMAEISSEIARAEAAEASIAEELSTEVSYLIANTDLGSIDSFAEVVADLSSEVARAESAEVSMTADFVNIYAKHVGIEAPNGTKTLFVLGTPVRTGSELVYLNGLLLTPSEDYTMNGNDVEFSIAPAATDTISAYGVC